MAQGNYNTEFPNFGKMPEQIDKLIAEGMLVDISWHNDCYPSFALPHTPQAAWDDDTALVLWVCEEDPEAREGENEFRYAVWSRANDENPVLQTDSIAAIVNWARTNCNKYPDPREEVYGIASDRMLWLGMMINLYNQSIEDSEEELDLSNTICLACEKEHWLSIAQFNEWENYNGKATQSEVLSKLVSLLDLKHLCILEKGIYWIAIAIGEVCYRFNPSMREGLDVEKRKTLDCMKDDQTIVYNVTNLDYGAVAALLFSTEIPDYGVVNSIELLRNYLALDDQASLAKYPANIQLEQIVTITKQFDS
jgi:hypothetical protein